MKKDRKIMYPRCTFLLLGIFVFSMILQAQSVSIQYPEESMRSRVERIIKVSHKNIVYDSKLLEQIKASTLKSTVTDAELLLSLSLKSTGLVSKKMEDGSYIIKKEEEKEPNIPSKEKGRGSLSGTVVDEKGEPIAGVSVIVSGTIIGAITDIDGNYKLDNIPTGIAPVQISCMSYETLLVNDVKIVARKTTPLNVVLKENVSQLNEVVVTSEYRKSSVVGLLSRQKINPGVTSGISADMIARTPDKNVGEALKRISGITTTDNRYIVVRGLGERYNGNMLNGQLMPSTELNRKNFNFDILPSTIVDNITVVKTLTPDRSAEFGGGLVDVATKDIPTEDFLQVSIGTSANDKTTGKAFRALQLDNKSYWGQVPDNRKLLGSLNWNTPQQAFDVYDKAGNKASLFSNNWALYKWTALPSYNAQLSSGKVLKVATDGQLGFLAAASYRHTLQTSGFRTSKDAWSTPVSEENKLIGSAGTSYTFSTTVSALASVGYRNRNTNLNLQELYVASYNQQLAIVDNGYNAYGNWGYNDNTTQTTLWQTQLKGERVLTGNIKLNGMLSYVYMDRQRPDNHFIIGDAMINPDDDSQVNISSASSAISGGVLRNWTRAKEKNLTWDANIFIPFTLSNNRQNLKIGYGGWYKDRMMYVINAFNSVNTSLTNAYFIPLNEYFTPEYGVNVELSRRFNDGYHRSAPLHAPYVMFDNRLSNKFRLVWGVRAEYYNVGKLNNDTTSYYGSVGKKWNVFPSANLTYNLIQQMNLRLAYARSVVRPDLRELARFDEYDWELGGIYSARALRYTFIDNFDFRYEWYPSAGEIISLSAFYKHIDYPMEVYKDATNREFHLSNSREAINYGIELELRKNFAFTGLPILKDMSASGNLTLIDGKVKPMYIGFVDGEYGTYVYDWVNRLQQGASPYAYNIGLYYDSNLLSVSLLYNATGRRCSLMVGLDSESFAPADWYEQPGNSLDAQIALKLLRSKQLEIKFSASNLLNSYSIMYQSEKSEKYDENKHWLIYRSDSGRTGSLTVSYKF